VFVVYIIGRLSSLKGVFDLLKNKLHDKTILVVLCLIRYLIEQFQLYCV
jgi:hypothetical protein